MESSAENVVPDFTERAAPPPSTRIGAQPDSFGSAVDTYAKAELERRHERIESMIEKARHLA